MCASSIPSPHPQSASSIFQPSRHLNMITEKNTGNCCCCTLCICLPSHKHIRRAILFVCRIRSQTTNIKNTTFVIGMWCGLCISNLTHSNQQTKPNVHIIYNTRKTTWWWSALWPQSHSSSFVVVRRCCFSGAASTCNSRRRLTPLARKLYTIQKMHKYTKNTWTNISQNSECVCVKYMVFLQSSSALQSLSNETQYSYITDDKS